MKLLNCFTLRSKDDDLKLSFVLPVFSASVCSAAERKRGTTDPREIGKRKEQRRDESEDETGMMKSERSEMGRGGRGGKMMETPEEEAEKVKNLF